jgi:CDGSH-type Zn-finger protein
MNDDNSKIKVDLMLNGPLVLHGDVVIKDAAGNLTERPTVTYFCRCGQSNNKPFCDSAHRKVDFQG